MALHRRFSANDSPCRSAVWMLSQRGRPGQMLHRRPVCVLFPEKSIHSRSPEIDMPNASSDRGKVTLSAVDLSKYSEELQRIIDRLNNARRGTTVKDAFGDALPSPINLYGQNSIIKRGIDLGLYKFLSPVMDVTFDSVTPTADDPVRVTFVANNMTDNIQVDILYYCPEHGWEVLQGERISDNQVAAYFHAGSSVMALIYREKGATVGTSQVSPQTGAHSTWPIAVSAIFFVSFGIFALYKSKKA